MTGPEHAARRRVGPRSVVTAALLATGALLAGCTGGGGTGAPAGTAGPGAPGTTAPTPPGTAMVAAGGAQVVTPVVAEVPVPPVPLPGSDGDVHLVYELLLTNATSGPARLDALTVVDDASGAAVARLGPAEVAERLQLVSAEPTDGTLGAAQAGVLFVHVPLGPGVASPTRLRHELAVTLPDAPPERRQVDEVVAPVAVDDRPVPSLGPPLLGAGYVAADACCDAHRHRRALLPVNGRLHLAQRYAVDWEQVDAEGRIYAGDRTDPRSYAIYGREARAMEAGVVIHVVDGLPEQVPGTPPTDIGVDEADGNAVVVDFGNGNVALYAHLQPGSIPVRVGDRVERGQVLGLVGNSGNSIAPHLHVHLVDAPLPIAASGVSYTIDAFTVTGRVRSTAAFDAAEADGTPLDIVPVDPPAAQVDRYPMDQSIVTFGDPVPAPVP